MTVVLTPANEKVGNCTLTWAEASRATSQTQVANAKSVETRMGGIVPLDRTHL